MHYVFKVEKEGHSYLILKAMQLPYKSNIIVIEKQHKKCCCSTT